MSHSGLIFGLTDEINALSIFWAIGFGGVILIVLQGLMSLFLGHHGDIQGESHEMHWGSYLSLKTITAMFIGVGFGGAAFGQNGFSLAFAATGGVVVGILISMLYLALMKGLNSLRSDGTALLWEAIGQRATVYLRIPGRETAPGEIQVSFGGRMMNLPAFTRGPEIPTGSDVLVIAVHGEHALEVEKISKDQPTLI